MKQYSWWGQENSPPDNLKTKKQLSELGLSPKNPVGFIKTRNYTLLLFDINDSESVKPKKQLTEKQKLGLEKNKVKREIKQFLHHNYRITLDYTRTIEWAKKWKGEQFLILDTETTGLEGSEIVEIAVIDQEKQVMMNTFVKPLYSIPDEVIRIHGITNEMVINSPSFADIYDQLAQILTGQNVLIYNANFDDGIISGCCRRYHLPRIKFNSDCLMEMYAMFVGEYSDYYDDYKWQPLNKGHRALDDCLRAFEVLEEMANSELVDIFEYVYDAFSTSVLTKQEIYQVYQQWLNR